VPLDHRAHRGGAPGEQPALPARHPDHGAAGAAVDREVVHQPPRARQPEPERAAGRHAVAQRRGDVGDAGPRVAHGDPQPAAAAALGGRQLDVAAAGVLHRVAGDLGDGGGDVLRLDARQPARLGEPARRARGGRHVDVRADAHGPGAGGHQPAR
jgi:hypothetical protein